jgi:hypothetical protein
MDLPSLLIVHVFWQKSSKIERNIRTVLSGLGSLHLLPTLFQGGGESPPNPQVLLERTVGRTLVLHRSEFFLFDIGQLGAALLGTRHIVCWPRPRRAASAQMTLDHRTGTHGLRLQQLRLYRAGCTCSARI